MPSQVKTGRPFQIGRGRRHGSSAVPVPGLPAVYDRGQQNRSVGTAKEGAEKQAEVDPDVCRTHDKEAKVRKSSLCARDLDPMDILFSSRDMGACRFDYSTVKVRLDL